MSRQLAIAADARARLEAAYERRTPRSAAAMAQARRYMVRGITRGWGYHRPYPLVATRGDGPYLIDLDGNRYVDLANNGLSLIHGHAFPPVVEALKLADDEPPDGWSAPRSRSPSPELCERIEAFERVRFTNSGTESGMLAVKVARTATGRPAILKAVDGFHGSFDDLEVGLTVGRDPRPRISRPVRRRGRLRGEARRHGPEIAAVVLEPLDVQRPRHYRPARLPLAGGGRGAAGGIPVRPRRLPDAAARLRRLRGAVRAARPT